MSDEDFTKQLALRLATRAADWVRPKIPSRALASALTTFVTGDAEARMYIPHYWAIYVHDGRGPFGTRADRGKRFLCWFRNPQLDPRLQNGEQVQRYSNVKRLSKKQFDYYMALNRAAARVGLPGPMTVTTRVHTPEQATNFFLNTGGMKGFFDSVRDEAATVALNYIREQLGDLVKTESSTLRF